MRRKSASMPNTITASSGGGNRWTDGSPPRACADAWYMGAAAEKMNYCKYRVSLDIFREMGLISLSPDLRRMEVLPVEGKVDMEASSVLASVRKMAGG